MEKKLLSNITIALLICVVSTNFSAQTIKILNKTSNKHQIHITHPKYELPYKNETSTHMSNALLLLSAKKDSRFRGAHKQSFDNINFCNLSKIRFFDSKIEDGQAINTPIPRIEFIHGAKEKSITEKAYGKPQIILVDNDLKENRVIEVIRMGKPERAIKAITINAGEHEKKVTLSSCKVTKIELHGHRMMIYIAPPTR